MAETNGKSGMRQPSCKSLSLGKAMKSFSETHTPEKSNSLLVEVVYCYERALDWEWRRDSNPELPGTSRGTLSLHLLELGFFMSKIMRLFRLVPRPYAKALKVQGCS